MSAEGYIKLHRQIKENEFWLSERFTKAQAWIDLLLAATYKTRTVFIRGIEINLNPGELCYSKLTLSKRWKWNERTVNKYLNMLENRQMIQTRITNVTTVISILKWNEYQLNTEQMQTRIHTNKNVKKVKKEKKNDYAIENLPIELNGELFLKTKFFYVTKSLITKYREKFQINLTDDDFTFQFLKMEEWIEKNRQAKDYNLFFIGWLKRAKPSNNNFQHDAQGSTIPSAHKYL